MNAKEYFKLTAKTFDKQKQYFTTRSASIMQESKELESQAIEEIVRVAIIDADIQTFVFAECPYIANIVRKRVQEAQQQSINFE